MTARRRGHLCHLQERKHALLHARTAGAGEQHDRQTLFGRVLEQAGQLFTDDRTHGRHHKMAVHHTDAGLHAADLAHAGFNGVRHADLFSQLCREVDRVRRCQIGVQLLKAVLIRDLTDARAREQSSVASAVRAHIQILAVGIRLQFCAAALAGYDLGRFVLLRFHFHRGLACFLKQVDQTHA